MFFARYGEAIMLDFADIALSQIVPLNEGQLDVGSGKVTLITDPGQWSFSAEANFLLPEIDRESCIVHIGLQMEDGVLGVGWLRQDRSDWVTRASASASAGEAEVKLLIPAGTPGGTLVFD